MIVPNKDRIIFSASQFRVYGAGSLNMRSQETSRGCPRRYQALYVERMIDHSRSDALRYGTTIHRALELMESNMIPPEEALKQSWDAQLPSEMFTEAVQDLDNYMARGGIMQNLSVIDTEIDLEAVLYEDEDFGTVYYRGIIDWLGVDLDAPQLMHIVDYKDLALDTLLATPSGWTTMGEVQVGDTLFGTNGQPVTVTGKSKVFDSNDCYKIVWDDNSEVIAGAGHEWPVVTGLRGGRRKEPKVQIVTTKQIVEMLDEGTIVRSPVAAALELQDQPECDVIDPYLLGVWLGDGSAASGAVTNPDKRIWDELKDRGHETGIDHARNSEKCESRTILGLRTKLRKLDLLDNKHLPEWVMRSSKEYRLKVLQGLIDTDGHWNRKRRRVVMNTTAEWQAEATYDLVVSLGWKATTFNTTAKWDDKEKPAYQVWFTPLDEPAGLVKVPHWWKPGGKRSRQRLIKQVIPVETVETQCIEVDSDDHLFLATKSLIPTHNTNRQAPKQTDLYGDVQLKGYHWLVQQNWDRWHSRKGKIITHLDAIKWRDYEVAYTRSDIEEWEAWAESVARQILRDEEAKPQLNDGCAWCPVRANCPVILDLPKVGATIAEQAQGSTIAEMEKWRAEADQAKKVLEKQLEAVNDSIKLAVLEMGDEVEVGDSHYYSATTFANEVDLLKLQQVIGDDILNIASTSKTGLENYAHGRDNQLDILACIERVPTGTTIRRKKRKHG